MNNSNRTIKDRKAVYNESNNQKYTNTNSMATSRKILFVIPQVDIRNIDLVNELRERIRNELQDDLNEMREMIRNEVHDLRNEIFNEVREMQQRFNNVLRQRLENMDR